MITGVVEVMCCIATDTTFLHAIRSSPVLIALSGSLVEPEAAPPGLGIERVRLGWASDYVTYRPEEAGPD